MNTIILKPLYSKLKQMNVPINLVCEVGVYLPETSNVINFIHDGIEAILVEPDPEMCKQIVEYFKGNSNVKLHQVAIFDHIGKLSLSKAGGSTFATDLPASPALSNDFLSVDNLMSFEVDCVTFNSIDTGNIELLSVDTEGCEWYVIKNLVSRPKIISLETHCKFYKNPYLSQINKWMSKNGYRIWYKTVSDTVYVKEGVIEITFNEKLEILKVDLKNFTRKFKKYIFWPRYYIKYLKNKK